MKRIIVVAILALMSFSAVNGQSNRKVNLQELGLSFVIPQGWSGGVKGDLYLLGHNSIPGLIVLSQNSSQSARELKTLALKGISAEGIELSPKGEFKLKGNDRVEGFYEGIFNGSRVKVYAIGLINRLGSGINIHVMTQSGKFRETHIREAEKLAESVNFFRRKESRATKFWKQRIAGRQLKYLRTRGGLSGQSQTTIIKLFADGSCYFYSSSGALISGASKTERGDERGKYKIYSVGNRSFLELDFGTKTLEYELSVSKQRNTLLDGNRYVVLDINRR